MTMLELDLPASGHGGAAAAVRGVADDMASIFGEPTKALPGRRGSAAAPTRRRRGWIGLGLGLTAATVAAGVIAGQSVTTTPQPQPATLARTRPAAPSPGPGVVEIAPVATPSQFQGIASPPVETAVPLDVRAAREAPPASVERETPHLVVDTVPQQVPPVPMAPRIADTPAPAASARPDLSCSDDDCLADRVQLADERLRDAFIVAQEAGVRRRTLRDYERTWDYARERSRVAPADALGVYASLTSTIRRLTREATRELEETQ